MKATTVKCALGIAIFSIALFASWQITGADHQENRSDSPFHSAPAITTWSKTYGGNLSDRFNSMAPTSDGGYIAVGFTESFSTTRDIWVVKLDADGNILWQKTFGGTGTDTGSAIAQTNDGGYIVAGRTKSFGAGNRDIWLVKLDSSGNIAWQKTFGSTGEESNPRLAVTNDGGYILASNSVSFGAGATDIWVIKLDSSGNITWQNSYGGPSSDLRGTVIQSGDGGYVVAGSLAGAAWLIKLDTSGNITWQKTYSGAGINLSEITSLARTTDGGYIAGGNTANFGAGGSDAWVLKLDSSGAVAWQKTYGGTGDEFVNFITATVGGGYIFSADTNSFGANKAWLVKLDGTGSVTWQKIFGGTKPDSANAILATTDSGFIVSGYTQSFGAGIDDGWIFKVDSNGALTGMCPPPSTTSLSVSDSLAVAADSIITPTVTLVSPNTTNVTATNTSITPASTAMCYLRLPLVAR